jgi:diguanylate cyclase (GGDEF)-like protein
LNSKKLYNIGLQLNQIENGYAAKLWPGAVACSESKNSNLIFFPGRSLNSTLGFDYQYNQIYNLMNSQNLDALVLYSSLISNFVSQETFQNFYSGLKKIPLISVGVRIPGVPSILIDNRSGIKETTKHLIENHGARRIAFIKGPENNCEASERFSAFAEEMAAHKVDIERNLIEQGDFTWNSARPAMDRLLAKCGKLPDAIMFANDEMGYFSMQYLQELGYVIPRDVAITGFDDIDEASLQIPQMTSIRQPYFDMSWAAVSSAIDLVEGRPVPEERVLPTRSVIRSSCGCLLQSVSQIHKTVYSINWDIESSKKSASLYDMTITILKTVLKDNSQFFSDRHQSFLSFIELYIKITSIPADDYGRQEEETKFLKYINTILETEMQTSRPLKDWHIFLTILSDSINKFQPEILKEHKNQLLLDLCVILVGELAEISQNSKNYKENDTIRTLQGILHDMSSIAIMEDLSYFLIKNLPKLNINTFFMANYEQTWSHKLGTSWEVPNTLKLVSGMISNKSISDVRSKFTEYPSSRIIPEGLLNDSKRRTLVVYPLFFREIQYGIIVFELTGKIGAIYETLANEISNIVKTIYLNKAKDRAEENLRRTLQELEVYNEQLSSLSISDELTGLYNRRGFNKLASQQLCIIMQMKKRALLLFCDLDGLKKINDKHGHKEGDWAIKQIGQILSKTFRNMDIVARLGGDEFTIFASHSDMKNFPVFNNRIKELIDETNRTSGKPFQLSLSLGAVESALTIPSPLKNI